MSVSRRQWYARSSPFYRKTNWRWTKEKILQNTRMIQGQEFFIVFSFNFTQYWRSWFYAGSTLFLCVCIHSIAWLMIRPGAVLLGVTFLRKLFWRNYKAIIFTDRDHSIEIRKCLFFFSLHVIFCHFLEFLSHFPQPEIDLVMCVYFHIVVLLVVFNIY